jgi:hypothetical protein
MSRRTLLSKMGYLVQCMQDNDQLSIAHRKVEVGVPTGQFARLLAASVPGEGTELRRKYPEVFIIEHGRPKMNAERLVCPG